MLVSISRVFNPKPVEALPWGSKSTNKTRYPWSAKQAPRLMVVVVLPTPPFWLAMAMIRGVGFGPPEAAVVLVIVRTEYP